MSKTARCLRGLPAAPGQILTRCRFPQARGVAWRRGSWRGSAGSASAGPQARVLGWARSRDAGPRGRPGARRPCCGGGDGPVDDAWRVECGKRREEAAAPQGGRGRGSQGVQGKGGCAQGGHLRAATAAGGAGGAQRGRRGGYHASQGVQNKGGCPHGGHFGAGGACWRLEGRAGDRSRDTAGGRCRRHGGGRGNHIHAGRR